MSETGSDGIAAVRRRFERARSARGAWEQLWQECYEFALPPAQPGLRSPDARGSAPPALSSRLFDGTAPDAVDQLAASLLARLTPPWSRWFGLAAGRDLSPDEQQMAGPELEAIAETLQTHFDRSNFAVEIHQCYLDLAAAGTACLLFEEAPVGGDSAFRFAAVPLAEAWLEESAQGRLDTVFRRTSLAGEAFRRRFPKAALDADTVRRIDAGEDVRIEVIEAVLPEPEDREGFRYVALRDGGADIAAEDAPLAEGRFQRSPFIAFRWLKAPGEAYGRSPVMKALPDIKTANKVVELVLKNASIAVTGIWQAEDDGVLNPANIKLVPGSIIPKAVGSAGLTPLEAPGKFDVSQLVLEDLRARIRHALMADALAQVDAPRMTATEVLERSADVVICDDVEVPGNSDTPAKRAALREKLSEIEFVLVPGGFQLYLGTPHTYYSIYADAARPELDETRAFLDGFEREAFAIRNEKGEPAWTSRYGEETIADLERRSGPIKFASQMMLVPMPPEKCRFDPGKLLRYSGALERRQSQGRESLWLEGRKLASVRVWWDPSLGRTDKNDRNAIAVVYQDTGGGYWLHRVHYFAHDAALADRDPENHAEADQLCRKAATYVAEAGAPAITVEDNGVGAMLPGLLRKALQPIDPAIVVTAHHSTRPKAERILAALDVPLAAGLLHAHESVCDGPFAEELRNWTPLAGGGHRDDGVDAVASAILAEPVRLGPFPRAPGTHGAWRPGATPHRAETEFEP
jgi:hypothetical protein